MNLTLTMLLIAFTALYACVSPEATRTRGGGPGADVGNRTEVVEMRSRRGTRAAPPRGAADRQPPMTGSLDTVLNRGCATREWKQRQRFAFQLGFSLVAVGDIV